ncbi:hypothetical protein A3758_13725 [Oleiphilus sp. HI0118]|uniref:alpha/beta hydrolase n=1 Tax=Oleiphilus sp. HI0079 TaxID=1822254 RepID=UPI0007C25AD7|nr:alpha/beta hydrolase [Oleiphilus sp. HI0079]KZZ13772.1 hypothetical protein A3750_02890 [Oleiphilus sp. HI0079]KZZ49904.1 hypothetical protein A3758_13725 [Oleiphilus sp. HI0118]
MNRNELKPPVVLVHGMWSTPQTLASLRLAFEDQGYDVDVPSLPFHKDLNVLDERTKRSLAVCSINDYVVYLERYLEQELTSPPILVGHSMGGLLAQLVAARKPCERLILLSSAAPAGMNGWTTSVVRTLGHNLLKFPLWKKTMDLKFSNIRYGIANSQSFETQHEISKLVTLESGRAAVEIGLWFLFRHPPTRVCYENVTCPVLIIAGTEDKITPLKIQQKINAKYPGRSTMIELKGVCHWTVGGSYFPMIQESIFAWLDSKDSTNESGNGQARVA